MIKQDGTDVTGGIQNDLLHRVEVCTTDFDQGQVYDQLIAATAGQVGAVVVFVGLVRDHGKFEQKDQPVETLTLEHYPGMTEKSIEGIVAKARQRWPLLASHVIHRVGELSACEQIVLVAVASAHRSAAFAAAEFIMDYLKTDAILWKREAGAGGSTWIESTAEDKQRQSQWQSD